MAIQIQAQKKALPSPQFSSPAEFIRTCEIDGLPFPIVRSDLSFHHTLIGERKGLRITQKDKNETWSIDAFRPLSGTLFLINRASEQPVEANLTLPVRSTSSSDESYCVLMSALGNITIQFLNHRFVVQEGSGGVFSLGHSDDPTPEIIADPGCQFVCLILTKIGLLQAIKLLSLDLPELFSAQSSPIRDIGSVFSIPQSEAFHSLVTSIPSAGIDESLMPNFLRFKFGEIICHLFSKDELAAPTSDPLSQFDIKRLEQVKAYLDANANNKTDLKDLARSIGMNRSRLSAGFKTLYGVTIREYRLHARLQVALTLLADPALSIESVAYQCGYNNAGNFTRAFSKEFGFNPSDIRR